MAGIVQRVLTSATAQGGHRPLGSRQIDPTRTTDAVHSGVGIGHTDGNIQEAFQAQITRRQAVNGGGQGTAGVCSGQPQALGPTRG